MKPLNLLIITTLIFLTTFPGLVTAECNPGSTKLKPRLRFKGACSSHFALGGFCAGGQCGLTPNFFEQHSAMQDGTECIAKVKISLTSSEGAECTRKQRRRRVRGLPINLIVEREEGLGEYVTAGTTNGRGLAQLPFQFDEEALYYSVLYLGKGEKSIQRGVGGLITLRVYTDE